MTQRHSIVNVAWSLCARPLPPQALGFLSPMAPLSFEPAAEASYKSSVFSQYPAKLLGERNRIIIKFL